MSLLAICFDIIAGIIFLGWSAETLVSSAVAIANHFKLPHYLIGMLLIGFGTSLPEFIVAIIAAMHGHGQMAIGNAIGSNIANIGLVLGVGTLIVPLMYRLRVLRYDLPIFIGISFLVIFIFVNDYLSRVEGVILLVILLVVLLWMFKFSEQGEQRFVEIEIEKEDASHHDICVWRTGLLCALSLIIVLASSDMFVVGAKGLATRLGVSDLFIGLTVVAVGTSLPELASTIVCAIRRHYTMAIGNVIGSNLFNLLAVIAMPALISPGPIPKSLVDQDYTIMIFFSVLLWIFLWFFRRTQRLSRWVGAVFVLCYVAYVGLLIAQN